jgi:hypothetical protein
MRAALLKLHSRESVVPPPSVFGGKSCLGKRKNCSFYNVKLMEKQYGAVILVFFHIFGHNNPSVTP